MLAVTASVTGSELLINLSDRHDVAEIQVEDGAYNVQSGAVSAGSFSLTAVNSIRVIGDAGKPGQMVWIKPGGAVADSLVIDASVDVAVINTRIQTSGEVYVGSLAITLSEDVITTGNQTYAGTLRLASDVVLDAGSADLRFLSEIRSTVGKRGVLLQEMGSSGRLALSADGTTLFVADTTTQEIHIADLQNGQSDPITINVGSSIGHLLLDEDNNRLYMSNPDEGSVSILDLASQQITGVINVGGRPESLAFSPADQRLFVVNPPRNVVTVIAAATNDIAGELVVTGSPVSAHVGPDGYLWVSLEFAARVNVVDVSSGANVASVTVGEGPGDIAFSPDGSRAYVVNNFDNTVSVVDTAGKAVVATVGVGRGPTAVAVSPNGRSIYVANGFSNHVTVIDSVTLAVTTVVDSGNQPVGLTVSSSGDALYTSVVEGVAQLGNDARGLTVRTTGTVRFEAAEATVDPLRELTVEAGQQIGPPVIVESAGSVTLGRNAAGEYLAGSDGSWTPITYAGFPLSDATFPNFLVPVAAERVGNTNQVLFLNPGGAILDFTFDDSWAYTATNDWSDPGTADFYGRETEFGIDVDGDGTIGQPAPGINVPPGAIATDGTQRTGDEQVIKRGGGTLVLDLANTHSGGTLVEEGTVIVRNATALGTGTLEVQPGATVKLEVGFGTVALPQLDLAAGAVLDLGEAQLTIGPGGADEATIRQWIIAGRGDGAFNGTSGLRSSAAATAAGSRTIGYTVGADGSATVMFTAIGDLNLDRKVDVFDLLAMDAGGRFGSTLPAGWSQGDLDYDGRTNIFDLLGIDTAGSFNAGSIVPAASGLEANVSSLTETTVSPAVATATAEPATAMSGAVAFARLAAGIEWEMVADDENDDGSASGRQP